MLEICETSQKDLQRPFAALRYRLSASHLLQVSVSLPLLQAVHGTLGKSSGTGVLPQPPSTLQSP